MNFIKSRIPALFLFKEHRRLIVIGVILSSISIVLEMASLGTIIPIFNVIFNKEQMSKSYGIFVDSLINLMSAVPQENALTVALVFFLIITLIKVGFSMATEAGQRALDLKIQISVQNRMFEKMIHSDLRYFIYHKSGDLVFRLVSLPQEVSAYFQKIPSLFIQSFNIILLSIFLLSISATVFFFVCLLGLTYWLVINRISKGLFQQLGAEYPKVSADINIIANEAVGGIREIILHDRRLEWKERFYERCAYRYKLKMKTSILRIVPEKSLEILIVLGMTSTGIIYGQVDRDGFILMMPVLMVFIAAMMRMIPSISSIGNARIQLATYRPSVDLFEKALNEKTIFYHDGKEAYQAFQTSIEFKNVGFSYNKKDIVLDNINIILPKNKTIAFVGSSGAGKTTLIDLLLGLYKVDEGEILIDGVNLARIKALSWRKHIGVVPQNSFIFNATVKENIAFDFKNIDMDKVLKAARAAGAAGFIGSLEQGYDTELGDRGYRLSGGQRQRIAIARALYEDPDIIIFDEATSAMDNRTERLIYETITQLRNHKTIIILSHRLSTIKFADRIYVLKNKQVLDSGTHDELLKKCEEYVQLYAAERS